MQDPYAGQGGSYTLDPKTGARTRVEEPTVNPADNAALLDTAVADEPSGKVKKTAPLTDFSTGA